MIGSANPHDNEVSRTVLDMAVRMQKLAPRQRAEGLFMLALLTAHAILEDGSKAGGAEGARRELLADLEKVRDFVRAWTADEAAQGAELAKQFLKPPAGRC